MLIFYTYFISVWAGSSQLSSLTKEVGSLWHGEVVAGWDLQWSHHSDIGAHPLIHSGGCSVFRRSQVGRTSQQGFAGWPPEEQNNNIILKPRYIFVKLDWTIYTPGGVSSDTER